MRMHKVDGGQMYVHSVARVRRNDEMFSACGLGTVALVSSLSAHDTEEVGEFFAPRSMFRARRVMNRGAGWEGRERDAPPIGGAAADAAGSKARVYCSDGAVPRA